MCKEEWAFPWLTSSNLVFHIHLPS